MSGHNIYLPHKKKFNGDKFLGHLIDDAETFGTWAYWVWSPNNISGWYSKPPSNEKLKAWRDYVFNVMSKNTDSIYYNRVLHAMENFDESLRKYLKGV